MAIGQERFQLLNDGEFKMRNYAQATVVLMRPMLIKKEAIQKLVAH